jgi:hypothetical protein
MLQFKLLRTKLKIKEGITTYLLLSIGEIFLIVIGIFLALQLDNWDKDQEYREIEQQYYQDIKDQLNDDKTEILSQIKYSNHFLEKYKTATVIISENDKTRGNELAQISLDLKNFSDFRRKSSIFQTLVNSGEIKHIKNKKLIQLLQDLEGKYVFINRLEEMHEKLILENIVPHVIKAIRITPLKIEDPDLLYNYYFQNIIILTIGLIDEKTNLYKDTIKEIEEILSLI